MLLANPGAITSDEYFHFLAQTATEPSPALQEWFPSADFRYPLLVSLKYLLAKPLSGASPVASLDEVIGAYRKTGFSGSEGRGDYILIANNNSGYDIAGKNVSDSLRRQARESLKILCQISYLHLSGDNIYIKIGRKDAERIFGSLTPIAGNRAKSRDEEIRRLASLFSYVPDFQVFNFSETVNSEVVESGFIEGTKVEKTHMMIERSSSLRAAYFSANPAVVCDVCKLDTAKTYPWADRVMDIHHLLPLCSGLRVAGAGTTFDDLVPLCPSCHRAVHRFYGAWFRSTKRKDFQSRDEAIGVYTNMKLEFPGLSHA